MLGGDIYLDAYFWFVDICGFVEQFVLVGWGCKGSSSI
jgi:hypothetical protein